MFHARDGLYFDRQPDGSVVVEKRVPDTRINTLEFRIELTAEAWASIVSSMSKAGESYETWKAALDAQR